MACKELKATRCATLDEAIAKTQRMFDRSEWGHLTDSAQEMVEQILTNQLVIMEVLKRKETTHGV